MKKVFIFFGYALLVVLVGELLAYPVFYILKNTPLGSLFKHVEFAKVGNRCLMIIGAVVAVYLIKKYKTAVTKEDFGYDAPSPYFRESIFKGFLFGFATMFLFVALLMFLDIRIFDFSHKQTFFKIIRRAFFKGLLTAVAVAFLEETIFRGLMFSKLKEKISSINAFILITFLYAFVHFIRNNENLKPEDIHWYSGVKVFLGSFYKFENPAFIGSFLTLLAVGAFLLLLRIHYKHIGYSIGVHMGWVCIIKMAIKLTDTNKEAKYFWMVGNYDRITGYLAFVYILIFLLLFYVFFMRKKKKNDVKNSLNEPV